MKEIQLPKWKVALVSDEDFERVREFAWAADPSHGYVRRSRNGKGEKYLHRFIVGAGPGEIVDHIDGNRLNNQRSNLRTCSNAENVSGQRRKIASRAGVKGVHRVRQAFHARITYMGKAYHLGAFPTAEEAARAYDAAALRLRPGFYTLNFPKEA